MADDHRRTGLARDHHFVVMRKVAPIPIRLEVFASLHAPVTGGELTTKFLKSSGGRHALNYSTSAAGHPIPGFSLAEADELFGASIDQKAAWKSSADVSRLTGKEV